VTSQIPPPPGYPLAMHDPGEAAALLRQKRVAALTGAGVSTESGIPDYRGPETARRARSPMRFADFVASDDARARYWSRSVVGWPRVRDAAPNAGHRALADLERIGALTGLITQNVDRLHQRAGSRAVVELHGSLHDVRCLRCGAIEPRDRLQARLLRVNPTAAGGEAAPDGDAEVSSDLARDFRPLGCLRCGGPLKPDVVFFGENVPPARVDAACAIVDRAEALLVVGTSLTVFSGFRFVKRAAAGGKPVVIVNLGPTRGDALSALRIDRPAGEALSALRDALVAGA
jgi:NAD+-dependent protein deacetylase sirtuin 4